MTRYMGNPCCYDSQTHRKCSMPAVLVFLQTHKMLFKGSCKKQKQTKPKNKQTKNQTILRWVRAIQGRLSQGPNTCGSHEEHSLVKSH